MTKGMTKRIFNKVKDSLKMVNSRLKCRTHRITKNFVQNTHLPFDGSVLEVVEN